MTFCEQYQIAPEDLTDIISVSKFIYDKIEEKKITKSQLKQDIEFFTKHLEIVLVDKTRQEVIELLFNRKRKYELHKTIRLYERGIIPSRDL